MLYDYICNLCGKEKEVEHDMTESPKITCVCGNFMKIIIGKPMIIFKGNGFTKKYV